MMHPKHEDRGLVAVHQVLSECYRVADWLKVRNNETYNKAMPLSCVADCM